jgi:hypothetical protein
MGKCVYAPDAPAGHGPPITAISASRSKQAAIHYLEEQAGEDGSQPDTIQKTPGEQAGSEWSLVGPPGFEPGTNGL